MILSDACQQFLNHCHSAVSLSQHTLRAYEGDLRDIETHVGRRKKLSDVSKEDLRQYIRHLREEKKLKESSIKRRIACSKLLFKWALQETIVESNPFDTLNERIRLPQRLPRALDSVDTGLLLKMVAPSSSKECYDLVCKKAAIYLLLETGIRVGELASICIDDLSLPDRCIKIQGKGNRQRLVYLLSSSARQVVEGLVTRRLAFNIFPYVKRIDELLENIKGKMTAGGVLVVRQYDGALLRLGPMNQKVRFMIDSALQASVLGSTQFRHYDMDRVFETIDGSSFQSKIIEFDTFQRVAPYPREFVEYFNNSVQWISNLVSEEAQEGLAHWLERVQTNGSCTSSYCVETEMVAWLS